MFHQLFSSLFATLVPASRVPSTYVLIRLGRCLNFYLIVTRDVVALLLRRCEAAERQEQQQRVGREWPKGMVGQCVPLMVPDLDVAVF